MGLARRLLVGASSLLALAQPTFAALPLRVVQHPLPIPAQAAHLDLPQVRLSVLVSAVNERSMQVANLMLMGAGHNGGGGGGPVPPPDPLASLAVYSGGITGINCVQPATQAGNKTWYFSTQTDSSTNTPAMGHTPLYYKTLGVPQAQWGDTNHPLYPIQNLFDFGSFPFTQSAGWWDQTTAIGNNGPLDGMNIYRGNPNNSVHQAFKDYNSLIAGDGTAHSYLHPGDEVVIRGATGANAGVWTIGGVPGTASPIGGATSAGLDEVNQSGTPVHVYIHGDPSSPRPIFGALNLNNSVGIILQGVNSLVTFDYTGQKSSRFMGFNTSQPSDGMTLTLGGDATHDPHVITWKTTPAGANDILIDPKGGQRTLFRTAQHYLNSADPATQVMDITDQQTTHTMTVPFASNPTNGTTLDVGGTTWTFVNTLTTGNQIQIATTFVAPVTSTLQQTLINAVTAFKAAANSTTSPIAAMGPFTFGSTATTLTFAFGHTFYQQTISALPHDGDPFNVHGVLWTWRNSPSAARDIQIGASISQSVTNADNATNASTDPLMTPWVQSGIGGIGQFTTLYNNPVDGTPLELNNNIWTFKTSPSVANDVQIGSIGWESLGNLMIANDLVTNPWGAGVTYASNGSGLLLISRTNGIAGIFRTQSTWHQVDLDTTINLSTFALGGTFGLHTSASAAGPMHDNILDDIFVTSWDGALTYGSGTAPRDLRPSTGSLGINMDTVAHPTVKYGAVDAAQVNGPWNAMDWTVIPNLTGVSLNGVATCTPQGANCVGTNSSDFNYCQTISNVDVWYTGTGMAAGQVHDTLMKNVRVNYTGDDQFDSYSSWDMKWDGFEAFNPLNNGLAFHPDFVQVGIVGTNVGVMWNNVFNAGHLWAPTDTAIINDPGWTDMNGSTKSLGGGPQGVNANGAIHHDLTITNSLFITYACLGISVEMTVDPTATLDIEGNTVLWPGVPRSGPGRCPNAPGIVPHVRPDTAVVEQIVMKNNVAHFYGLGGGGTGNATICPLGSNVTMASNKIVTMSVSGAYILPTSVYCPNGGSSGSPTKPVAGAPPSSTFDGGVTYAGTADPTLSFVAYPVNNPLGNGNLIDAHPLPAGLLDSTGVPTTLCCNVDGNPRNPTTPNIGAY